MLDNILAAVASAIVAVISSVGYVGVGVLADWIRAATEQLARRSAACSPSA